MPGPKLFARAKPPVKPAPEIPEFSSLGVSEEQITKAVRALLAYAQKTGSSNDLLDGDAEESLFLSVALKRASPREFHNPVRIPVAHPMHRPPRTHSVCLFVKDKEEAQELLEAADVHFVNKVMSLDKLTKKYKSFEAKRELLREYDVFLVDDRVLVEVARHLGKMWRKAKKNPHAVSITKKSRKAELEKAIASTYLVVNMGTNLSLRVGTLAIHTEAQLVDNVKAATAQLAARAPQGGWDNIQNLYLKTNSSAALPVYYTTLDDRGRFSKRTADDAGDAGNGASNDAFDDGDNGSSDEEEKPHKKAKKADSKKSTKNKKSRK